MAAPRTDRARLRRGLEQIHNPIALATKYLASRHLLGGPDEDDLMDVAIQAIVDAAMAWDPAGGRSMTSWAYLYLDRNVYREIGRIGRRQAALEPVPVPGGAVPLHDAAEWLRYDAGTDAYDRVELRADLQRWADLAELTPLMRFVVEYAALHLGAYTRDTALADAGTPLHEGGYASYKNALGHLRRAAVTGQRRDDRWTRMRAQRAADRRGPHGTEVRADRLLAELRADEQWRTEVLAAGAAAAAVPDDDLAETG